MVQPKKSLLKIKPYSNGSHSRTLFEKASSITKLDSNESSLPISKAVQEAICRFVTAQPLHWYPDIQSEELIAKLSRYTGLAPEFIQTFGGSDNGLETVARTYLDHTSEAILCAPTYDHFRLYAESTDATVTYIYGESAFTPKPERLLASVTPKTKIIYIVNPNNPTGSLYSQSDIESLLKAAPQCLIIVDEAYFEFCGQTMASLVTQYANLLVSRSFSKAFGMAGLRIGYVLAHPDRIAELGMLRVGKNINSLAQVAACAALDDIESMFRYVHEVQTTKEWLIQKITEELGLEVISTPANFFLVRVFDAHRVTRDLMAEGIYVRDRSTMPQMEGLIRITVGHRLAMEKFWKAMKWLSPEILYGSPALKAKA